MIVGVGSDFFGPSIYYNPKSIHVFDGEFVEFFYKILPVAFSIFGASLSFILYTFKKDILFSFKTSNVGRKIYTFLNKKWFFDKIYNEVVSQFFFKFGYSMTYKNIDRGTFEIMGPTGLSAVALKTANSIHKAQTGSLYHYALIILIIIAFLLFFRNFWVLFSFNIFDFRLFVFTFITLFFISKIK